MKYSPVGYTFITNNVAQSLTTGSSVNFGTIQETSCAQNISLLMNGQGLQVEHCGTYLIDTNIIATTAADAEVTLGIYINGVQRASIQDTAPFSIRGVFQLQCGDIISLQNASESTLTLTANTQPGGYNVSTIIQRYN